MEHVLKAIRDKEGNRRFTVWAFLARTVAPGCVCYLVKIHLQADNLFKVYHVDALMRVERLSTKDATFSDLAKRLEFI